MGGNVLCAAAVFAAFCQYTKGSRATSYQVFMQYRTLILRETLHRTLEVIFELKNYSISWFVLQRNPTVFFKAGKIQKKQLA